MADLSPEQSIFDYAGGEQGVKGIVEIFYNSIFSDPVLLPVFKHPRSFHIDHLTAFLSEEYGGPTRYTDQFGGMPALVAKHRGLKITEEQRQRFIALFMSAVDKAGFSGQKRFIETLRTSVTFGAEVARVNSNVKTDSELYPLSKIPKWNWEDV
jgi:hemoglobin